MNITNEVHDDIFEALVGKAVVERLYRIGLIDEPTMRWSCDNIWEGLSEHFDELTEINPLDSVDAYFEATTNQAETYCDTQWNSDS